jgi:CRISPR-associated protein (TIGR02710 family)
MAGGKRALVVSLGADTKYAEAVGRVVALTNPQILRFILGKGPRSEAMQKAVEKIVEKSSPADVDVKFEHLRSPENFDRAFDKALGVIDELLGSGVEPGMLSVDFTAGTKAMSAGLAVAGLQREVASLIYVGGKRGKDGKVIPGTESVNVSMRPMAERAKGLLRDAVKAFNARHYKEALRLAKKCEDMRVQTEADLAARVGRLAKAYWLWDALDWKGANESLDGFQRADMKALGIAEALGRNKEGLKELVRCGEQDRFAHAQVVDVFLGAKRRLKRGEPTEAVAWLYRCLELLAQVTLWKERNIDTRDVHISLLPQGMRDYYESLREDRTLRLPLWKAYGLLKRLELRVGELADDERFRRLVYQRNDSAMAHGLGKIREESAEEHVSFLEEVVREYVPESEEWSKNLRHPMLPEGVVGAAEGTARARG